MLEKLDTGKSMENSAKRFLNGTKLKVKQLIKFCYYLFAIKIIKLWNLFQKIIKNLRH